MGLTDELFAELQAEHEKRLKQLEEAQKRNILFLTQSLQKLTDLETLFNNILKEHYGRDGQTKH